jgi:hypothetical protein
MKRTKLVYMLGRNEKELLADDEYDEELWLQFTIEEAAKWKKEHSSNA